MKKIISVILSVLLLLSLFAGCDTAGNTDGTQAPEKEVAIQVGYARENISCDFAVPLRGYGNSAERLSTGTEIDLYSTCIAFRDEFNNTILLFHNDLIGAPADPFDGIRQEIEKETGVPFDQIFVAGTHTHHAPDITLTGDPSIQKYNKMLKEWLVSAAKAAIADLKPAKMYTTKTEELVNLNFIRHYLMKDGSVSGDNFGDKASGYASHVSDADSVMQLVKFTREGGKDVVLVNWQTHPHRTGGSGGKDPVYYMLSSDIVGVMRQEMEAALDCNFIYFTGASGNVNPVSKFPWENITKDYKEQGKALADAAIAVAPNFTQVKTGKVQSLKTVYTAKPKTEGTKVPDIPLYAFSIGDVAFVTAPYEMFDANGKQIKEGSPFGTTIVCTVANAHLSYIPSYEGYEYNGVISYGAKSGKYARGTGEELVAQFDAMLEKLYETKY